MKSDTPTALPPMPADWRDALADQLAPEETIEAWLTLDLDPQLQYANGLLVLTRHHLWAREASDADWRNWPHQATLTLQPHDHAGVGSLALFNGDTRLALWRYTLEQMPAAQRLATRYTQRNSATPHAGTEADICPACQTPLPPDSDSCPLCSREDTAPSSTWVLFRLWRFAHPYRLQLLAGFLLTLAATAATLVPPYLTMPLMDEVLIPYQNGKPINTGLVMQLLGGLLGSALLAWALGWARTYILARVSERIGSDLRTITYEHLLRLSLEYFGAKRTGDLMARIGSGNRPHLCVSVAAPARFRHRCADDRDDGHHPVFHQPVAGAGHAGAAAVHRLGDSRGARPAAYRL